MSCRGGGTDLETLEPAEQVRYEDIRTASGLPELASRLGYSDEHEAYFAAKSVWYELRGKLLSDWTPLTELPGDCVSVDGQAFHVHGITHADTEPERRLVRDHAQELLEQGATVYCEQGIRRMYFEDLPAVYEIDDYSWAAARCREMGLDSHVDIHERDGFAELTADVRDVAGEFRDVVFSLIDSGRSVYGDGFGSALGDIASDFLMSHEEFATGEDFTSFRKSRVAAENPERLLELQRYYKQVFLPQPIEREWLRRHDPELELFTHARNERMADFAVYNSDDEAVHLIVGAAHQPGICYYLDEHRTGDRTVKGYEPTAHDRPAGGEGC